MAVSNETNQPMQNKNGWNGIIVNGCIRDAAAMSTMDIGVKALGSHPRKTKKLGDGARDIPVTFGGVTFEATGDYVVCDEDGIVVMNQNDVDV